VQNTAMLFLPLPQNKKQNGRRGSHERDQALRISGAVEVPGTDMIDRHWSLTRGTDIWSLLVTVQLLTDSFNKHSISTSTMNTESMITRGKTATGKENNIVVPWGLF
jgi:hypothetical protein